jgi:hypothetical protein
LPAAKMRGLLASKLSHAVEFQLATLGNSGGGET